ncbi:MAG: hypothetical protein Q4B87_02875 [Candidatus Saccharibacteria bacterium]|nr:hypothetical protein [Candidatus Saccharibacteria bacterium]
MANRKDAKKDPEYKKPRQQTSLFDNFGPDLPLDKTGQDFVTEVLPATELMKQVAVADGNVRKMQKSFTTKEIEEIMRKREKNEQLTKEENSAVRIATRANKKWVRAQAVGDYGKLYFYPSYTSNDGEIWYKMMDFSALYYAYYLAPRMGRTANIFDDKDSYAKAKYIASVKDIDGVVDDFLKLGGKKVEKTLTGVYIFTLANPLTADDFSNLMRMEEERRDRARNMMRPAKMAPVTYKLMVEFVSQIGPKIKRLEKRDYFSIGEDMVQELENTLEIYYTYSDGHLSIEETGEKLLVCLNRIKAGLTILQETNAWDGLDTAAMLGESLMFFRDQIIKDFRLSVGKKNAKS